MNDLAWAVARAGFAIALLLGVLVGDAHPTEAQTATDQAAALLNAAVDLWIDEDAAGALRLVDRAIGLQQDWDPAFNLRALVRVSLGQLDGALRDANLAVALAQKSESAPGALAANLDTRAYVYLNLGRYGDAARDYGAVLATDLPPAPHWILGAGLVQHALGDSELAGILLTAGLDLASVEPLWDPQLADLVTRALQVIE